jgi:hypothetical protein
MIASHGLLESCGKVGTERLSWMCGFVPLTPRMSNQRDEPGSEITSVGVRRDSRGSAVDRTDWKAYIIPLLFFKRISDVWDEETAEAAASLRRHRASDFPEVHRFNVPRRLPLARRSRDTRQCRRRTLPRHARDRRANPDTLFRVFGAADWGNRKMLTDEISRIS